MIERRKFLIGLGSLIAAPAIVRVTSIMPVRSFVFDANEVIFTVLEEYDAKNIAAFFLGSVVEGPNGTTIDLYDMQK